MRWFVALLLPAGCVMPNPAWQSPGATTAIDSSSAGVDTTSADVTTTSDTTATTTDPGSDTGSTTGAIAPAPPPSLCGGRDHSCAVIEGVVHCWGGNRFGALGNGSVSTSATPVQVSLGNPAVQVACGEYSTCAALEDGSVWCWGRNVEGTLGYEGEFASREPHRVPGLADASAIAMGDAHACAIARDDGSVWCWGRNSFGASGTDVPGPVQIPGLLAAREVTTGANHSCVLLQDNSVHCWGANDQGQAGAAPETLPKVLVPTSVNVTEAEHLDAGGGKTCVTKTDGSLWCWGAQLDGSGGSATPSIIAGVQDVVDVALGPTHTCVARAGGTVRCLGSNRFGQGGNVDPLSFARVVRLAAGTSHTCAADDAGQIWCFGRGDAGQLGRPQWFGVRPPAEVTAHNDVLLAVARDEGTCELYTQGSPRAACWGRNEGGRLGDLTQQDAATPVDSVPDYAEMAQNLRLGRAHGCLSLYGQSIWCWGDNDKGQLGDATTTPSPSPVQVNGLADWSSLTHLSVGDDHTCISNFNTLTARCWGQGEHGELGNGSFADSNVAVDVTGVEGVYGLGTGAHHSCAVRGGSNPVGAVYCWGRNDAGQLGDQSYVDRAEAVRVVGSFAAKTTAAALACGDEFSCVIAGANGAEELWCWGSNREGQWGTVPSDGAAQATKVADIPGAQYIAAGDHHLCLVINGEVSCTGANEAGQLGDGTTVSRANLTPVTGLDLGPIAELTLGSRHTCARSQDRRLACFGSAYFGQLGEGTIATDGATPLPLAFTP